MEMNAEQKAAIDRIAEATEQLNRVQELARVATSAAGNDRARAVRDALKTISPRELSSIMQISVQRVYKIARDADQGA